MPIPLFRTIASLVSLTGLVLLCMVLLDWHAGDLAHTYFPDQDHRAVHHRTGLLLALPVPLHVLFIGLIVQKKWLSVPMQRTAWLGITTSGLWLGGALGYRYLFL